MKIMRQTSIVKSKGSGNRISFTGYDPVESPEAVISSDKNIERKKAFADSYKRVMQIIPEYFILQRKKRKKASGSSGGNSFTQNIIVTPENVKIETKGIEGKEEILDKEQERERE